MATKEISFEFIRETGSKKYFLVKKTESEYFIFRAPPSSEKSKNQVDLANWEGEIVPWGGVPAKVRDWILRKKVQPDARKPEILVTQT